MISNKALAIAATALVTVAVAVGAIMSGVIISSNAYGGGGYVGSQTIIAAGSLSSQFIDSDGRMYTWGIGNNGRLGNGTTTDTNTPTRLSSTFRNKQWKSVATGGGHTAAIDTDGYIYSWGTNFQGELGNGGGGDGIYSHTPVPLTSPFNTYTWAAVSAGERFTVAITTEGIIYSWGVGGMLGRESMEDSPIPIPLAGSFQYKTWKAVSAGWAHVLAIDTSGIIYSWGDNRHGALGNGTAGASSWHQGTPATLTSSFASKTWKAVSGGDLVSFAIDTAGKMYAWGSNFQSTPCLGTGVYGEEGSWGSAVYDPSNGIPKQLGNGFDQKTWIAVSTSFYTTVAIDSDGKIFTWGSNDSGQLGNGTTDDKEYPTALASPFNEKTWVAVVTGGEHTLAVDNAGNVYSWGDNSRGQLGDGTNVTGRLVPTLVELPSAPIIASLSGGKGTGAGITSGSESHGSTLSVKPSADGVTSIQFSAGAGYTFATGVSSSLSIGSSETTIKYIGMEIKASEVAATWTPGTGGIGISQYRAYFTNTNTIVVELDGVDRGIYSDTSLEVTAATSAITYTITYDTTTAPSGYYKLSSTYTMESTTFDLGAPTPDSYNDNGAIMSFVGWRIGSTSGTVADNTSMKSCVGDVTLYAEWGVSWRIGMPRDMTGYTIEPLTAQTVMNGGSFDFKVTVDEGYSKSEYTIDYDSSIATLTKVSQNTATRETVWRLSNITGSQGIEAVGFSENTYTVTVNETPGVFMVEHITTGSVTHGGSYRFKVVMDPKYDQSLPSMMITNKPGLAGWTSTGVTLTDQFGTPLTTGDLPEYGDCPGYWYYKVDAVTYDTILSAGPSSYWLNSYRVWMESDMDEGTYHVTTEANTAWDSDQNMSFATPRHGETFTFKVTLDPDYSKSDFSVIATGQKTGTVTEPVLTGKVGNIYTYKLVNVTERTVISVSGVELNTYVVSLPNGEFDGKTFFTATPFPGYGDPVVLGEDFWFVVTLSVGYTNSNLTVKTTSTTATLTQVTGDMLAGLEARGYKSQLDDGRYACYYILSNINADQTITVTGVSKDRYTINLQSDDESMYTLSSIMSTLVEYGESFMFKVTLTAEFAAANIIVEGVNLSDDSKTELECVEAINGDRYYILDSITAAYEIVVRLAV